MKVIETYGLILFIVLVLSAVIQLYYYIFVFGKFAFYKPVVGTQNKSEEPVSIIIAARNEYANLEKSLKSILEQDYPNYEVIVVNDCSWDDSQKLLEYYQKVYSHLKICQLIEQEKYPTGKKFALTMGIKAAKNNKLLFTDADCAPASNQWLRLMQEQFTTGKEIVLGFSPYKGFGSLLSMFIQYESGITAIAYFSAAIANRPFMGVGRNLGYTKDLFFKNKGFASHQHILSGDDDLFVNETATSTNVSIQTNPDSFVYTEAKKTYTSWSRQKARHVSTGKYYKANDKFFLGLYYASLMFFYPAFAWLLVLQIQWQVPLGVFGVRFLVQMIIMYFALKKLKYVHILWLLPVLDVIYLFYIIIFGTRGLLTRKQKNW
jgi:glycosyltransferase involved in cell wall biosynthesis